MLQRGIGNQATLRLLAQRAASLTGNEPSGDHKREVTPESMTALEAPRVSWDFSKIPLFPPDRANRPQPSFPPAAMPLPGVIQDQYEQEADRVANEVVAMPTRGGEPRRQALRGQSNGSRNAASVAVGSTTGTTGQPLEPSLRQEMEQRFGHDFARVRVHTGSAAAQSAQDVNARAYTVGNDIVFGTNQFAPGSREGCRLLVHELTHVTQQASGSFYAAGPVIQRKVMLTGTDDSTRKEFMKKINDGSTVSFKLDQSGNVPDNAKATANDFYTKSILDFINNTQTVNLRLIPESAAVFVDEFRTGEVDSADMLKEPTALFHVDLFHILTERFATPDYEKVVANEKSDATHDANIMDKFSHAHNIAVKAEEKFLKALFPKKHIEYQGQQEDQTSKKVDKDGNGTITFIHDFTDVQKFFVQPVVKGQTVENIIKADLKIVR